MTSTNQQQVIARLQEELKALYRKCVDADQKLSQFRTQGMGKFSALFGTDSPFDVQAKTFSDYLAEAAADLDKLTQLPEQPAQQWQDHLNQLLIKLQAIHQLLARFKAI
ncbi:hypothetical protein GCM10011369_00080 [Neiella marina]|uniref:Prephenate dehydrogenase n=1 Tax=Neiella marina TaxID=508461 RepID=A0A8J2U1L5_9GAMM|nr:hypothetical protein [Neiella marina]GGA62810.1 hypothetical protein GCM10011369_00080 [Neiella marina]